LRREGLPARTKRAATLGVDRHGSGQCGDGKGAKEDERGDIAVGDQRSRSRRKQSERKADPALKPYQLGIRHPARLSAP
jgi:hypothetical protein